MFSIVNQKTSSGGEGTVPSQPTARYGRPSHALAQHVGLDPAKQIYSKKYELQQTVIVGHTSASSANSASSASSANS